MAPGSMAKIHCGSAAVQLIGREKADWEDRIEMSL
jgi:hypothetical protein